MKVERFNIPHAKLVADTNIRLHYPINQGQWIVHPGITDKENSFCRYSLDFELAEDSTFDIHVSADNRFELRCDDEYIGMGPDRSDINKWSFHSYRLTLEKGKHSLDAEVHFLAEGYPFAQTSIEPGFVLFSEDAPVDINTGTAKWKVQKLTGIERRPKELRTFLVVGPNYDIKATEFFNPEEAVDPIVVQKAGRKFGGGNIHPKWKLYPSRLPEQIREPAHPGRVRVVDNWGCDDPIPAENGNNFLDWQNLVSGKTPLTIPPNTEICALWDLENYFTFYPEITTKNGEGSSIEIEFAESCYHQLLIKGDGKKNHIKDNRNEFTGKYFRGFGDVFHPDGEMRTFRPFWWRSGRYARIRIKTAEAPLTIDNICLMESRMPLENESIFNSNDKQLDPIIDVSVRGIQMCAHETYMDCPYYEQMMYVGDTRIQMLVAYVMSSEDRLNQRALELFDWSRRETGFVLERHPSQLKQLSLTFSMIWILMLRDYAWWRNDSAFIRERLKGMRCMLEEFKELQGEKNLMPALPGWSFIDWIGDLSFVNNPGPNESGSSIVNLLFLNALNCAAELEEAFGENHLAEYNREWADELAKSIKKTFWNEELKLFDDYPDKKDFSEHAQCLALLSGHFPEIEKQCFESLITTEGLTPTTVYFSHYLLDTFAKFGRGDLILKKFDFWKDMVKMGFKTPVETPEPSRSDCHAWGSHPLFHMHASIAGIRPASPGFEKILISPNPGDLTELKSSIPHPAGRVDFQMMKQGEKWQVEIKLPPGITAKLRWNGVDTQITENSAEFYLDAEIEK